MEKTIIFILALCVCSMLVVLWRREHTITELTDTVGQLRTELGTERTRRVLSERTVAGCKYRVTECSRAVSSIAARNGTIREIVAELRKRFTEMEELLLGVDSSDNTGVIDNSIVGGEQIDDKC